MLAAMLFCCIAVSPTSRRTRDSIMPHCKGNRVCTNNYRRHDPLSFLIHFDLRSPPSEAATNIASTTTHFRLVSAAKRARLHLRRTSETRRCRLPTCPSPLQKPAANAKKGVARFCERRPSIVLPSRAAMRKPSQPFYPEPLLQGQMDPSQREDGDAIAATRLGCKLSFSHSPLTASQIKGRSGRLAHLQPRNPRADPLDCVTTNDCNCRMARLVAHAWTFRHNDTHYATPPRPAPQVNDILLMLLSMNQHHIRR